MKFLRSATDLCCCVLETATKLRAFDEAPYTSSAVMLAALVRHAQLEQLEQLQLVGLIRDNVEHNCHQLCCH